jgi:RNA-directed DNA polymerase
VDAQESSKKEDVSTKQRRIAENAKNQPETSFTSLAHHMDERWLYEAYKRTRKDGAVGIDEQTALAYGQNLKENLKKFVRTGQKRKV